MKKILFTLTLLISVAFAYADNYGYLTFTNTDGTEQSVAVNELTVTFSDNKLIATNSVGSVTLSLPDLAKMYFSETEAASIREIDASAVGDGKVDVFSASGALYGKYDSLDAARTALKQGTYVLKAKGRSFKVVVR